MQAALTEFVQDAAGQLAAALVAGAEIAYELESRAPRGRGGWRTSSAAGPTLYAYRALTGEFIAQHVMELERLPSHAEAMRLLEGFDGLDRYLASVTGEAPRGAARLRARAALIELLTEVFDEQTSFELRPERLHAALERLERSALADAAATTLVATLHGLAISSSDLPLTSELTIARPDALEGLPDGALAPEEHTGQDHLIVALAAVDDDPAAAIARGRKVLMDLLRALRLFGDGRVTLGALAWARVGAGRWRTLTLGTGGRPHGMLLVPVEQEDELRAFCNLVSRRAPQDDELAWALGRFELGCERSNSLVALTDYLLALRALLEPEGPASGLLPGRLAALCAIPERRIELTERAVSALDLERAVIAGTAPDVVGQPAGAHERLVGEIANHLRALLRDVICGHLDANLLALADELLLAGADQLAGEAYAASAPTTPADAPLAPTPSVEQMLGDAGQPAEILDVFI